MSKVYVVQEPMMIRHGRPALRYSLDPAKVFGEIIFLLDWSDTKGLGVEKDKPLEILDKLWHRLKDYQNGDYMLMTGNWTAMALAVHVALEVNDGQVTCLQWDSADSEYRVIELDTGTREET